MKAVIFSLLVSLLLANSPYLLAENTKQRTSDFNQKLSLHRICFEISSTGITLRIVPSGLKKDNSPIERTIDGAVSGADIGDINKDKSPEIYIYVKAKDSVSLVAYSANNMKSPWLRARSCNAFPFIRTAIVTTS
jgi:hypothetical protein